MNMRALVTISFLAAGPIYGQAPGEEINAQQMQLIIDTATNICNTVPIKGHATSTEVSGAAKAELPTILKKLTDAGLEGAGKYSSVEYEGVLQKDLATALQANADCKLKVLQLLVGKVLVGSSLNIRNSGTGSSVQGGPVSTGNGSVVPLARHMDRELSDGLLGFIPRAAKVTIFSAVNNSEAYHFAEEIKQFLISQGYDVEGVKQAFMTPPVSGTRVDPVESGKSYEIKVGERG